MYEGLLLKMGEKASDGGQFFTPREIIRAMVKAVDPVIGETVYDPCCGTGGFLAQSYNHMRAQARPGCHPPAPGDAQAPAPSSAGEKENLVYPIALANLVLHGIDQPNLWHGNTLTGHVIYGGLFKDARGAVRRRSSPTRPSAARKARTRRPTSPTRPAQPRCCSCSTSSTNWPTAGAAASCSTRASCSAPTRRAFVQTKRKLLDDCDLWAIVSLPGGVFTAAGAA